MARLETVVTITHKHLTARIRWNPVPEEYVVELIRDGVHMTDADYFTDDFEDAFATARAMIGMARPHPAE